MLVRLGLVEPPQAARLVRVAVAGHADDLAEGLQDVVLALDGGEELAVPGAALGLFLDAHVALRLLDLALLDARGVHVALGDGLGDARPGAARLERVLLLDGGDGELRLGRVDGVVGGDEGGFGVGLGGARVDLERLVPLPGDVVEDLLVLACRVDCADDGVLLAGEPALATVVDLCGVPAGARDEAAAVELDKG